MSGRLWLGFFFMLLGIPLLGIRAVWGLFDQGIVYDVLMLVTIKAAIPGGFIIGILIMMTSEEAKEGNIRDQERYRRRR